MAESDPAPQRIDKTPPRPAPTLPYSCTEYNPNIRILYIRTHEQADLELAKLGSGPQVLGFDLEWKPNFRKGAPENPVALVQLSNHDTIFLLQITAMKEFPSKLAQVLANPLIVKAGVAIQNDAKKMCHDCQVPLYNCVDLSLLARTVDNARWKGKYNNPLGLARLTETYEYRLLPKGRTTRSNWEAILDDRQIEYAGNDAHAGYTIYRKLETMIPSLQDPPESVWYTFNLVSGRLLNSDGLSWHAHNPNYDPGPPPPPRIPREPKSTDIQGPESHSKGENKDGSNAYKTDRKLPRALTSQLGRVDVERRPRSSLPSHPYGAAYQGQGQSQEGSSSSGPAQQQPNKNRVHQQRRNANFDRDSQTSYTLPVRTSHTQPSGAFPIAPMKPSAQLYEDATHFNRFPSNDSGGGNDGPRMDPKPGLRNNPQINSNRFRNSNRNYRRPDYLPGQDASNS